MSFENLAGKHDIDEQISEELTMAGIDIVHHPRMVDEPEVHTYISGSLFVSPDHNFGFIRHWYYWGASGFVPMEIALKMYNDPIGRKDIRVVGHCGCPPPDKKRDQCADQYLWAEKDERLGYGINYYHIDSLTGLKLYADSVKKMNVRPRCKVCGGTELEADPAGYYCDYVSEDGYTYMCVGACANKKRWC